MRTILPVMNNKSDREKIEALTRCVKCLIDELNETNKTTYGLLPVGTVIMRRNPDNNAGMTYGIWSMCDDIVVSNDNTLYIYIRVE